MGKKLYKCRREGKIDGVCAGVAKFFGIDVTLVRLIWMCSILFGGTGIVLYIVCMIVMPREPREDFFDGGDGN